MTLPSSISQQAKSAIDLLCHLISESSFSGEEQHTAEIISQFLQEKGVKIHRQDNNVWAFNRYFDEDKPTILINSHHDTVKPNAGYTKNPFEPIIEDGKLFGLGSNDAGGCLVSLVHTFVHFYKKDIPYNLVLAATAEEENSGKKGVESILAKLPDFEFGMVGEPTEMQMAVSEKGLMVLDCYAHGKAGHAARDEGINAIYEALKDIEWFRSHQFEKTSRELGPVKMSVTVINAGKQHNVVPDTCHFVVDVRTTDAYQNAELLEEIKKHVTVAVKARSTRLNPSYLPESLKVAQLADTLGIKKYGSPTLSDQALMRFPTFKMGPGKSARSHTADEFIYVDEIEKGIAGYIELLEELFKN